MRVRVMRHLPGISAWHVEQYMNIKSALLLRIFLITLLCMVRSAHSAELILPLQAEPNKVEISLRKIVLESVLRNTSAMSDYLQSKMSQEQIVSEGGIFDPVFQANALAKDSRTKNSAEEAVNRQASNYSDTTNTLELGLTGLLPIGTTWDLKFNQNKHSSTVIDRYTSYGHEYDNGLLLTVTQPLLKNFGTQTTMSKINLAELQSDIDTTKFEQKLMELVGVVIQTYWKLYGAQQIYDSWEKSIVIAGEALKDLEMRAASGKISQTEYLENVSAVSIRKAEFHNAKSKVDEAQNQLLTLLNLSASDNITLRLIATDSPFGKVDAVKDAEYYVRASLERWPEYRAARKKVDKERVQIAYFDNQSLPQFDLIGSFGSTSLDSNYDKSFRYLTDGGYLNWSVGLKLSIPMDSIQADSNLKIAKIRAKQAELELDSFVKSYANSLYTKVSEVRSYQSQLQDYETGLRIKGDLLEIERQKLKSGRTNLKSLLDKQDDYIAYQRRVLSGVVNCKISEAQLEIATGKVLEKYNVDPASITYSDEMISGKSAPLFVERTK